MYIEQVECSYFCYGSGESVKIASSHFVAGQFYIPGAGCWKAG
jgi:hypothetical protein